MPNQNKDDIYIPPLKPKPIIDTELLKFKQMEAQKGAAAAAQAARQRAAWAAEATRRAALAQSQAAVTKRNNLPPFGTKPVVPTIPQFAIGPNPPPFKPVIRGNDLVIPTRTQPMQTMNNEQLKNYNALMAAQTAAAAQARYKYQQEAYAAYQAAQSKKLNMTTQVKNKNGLLENNLTGKYDSYLLPEWIKANITNTQMPGGSANNRLLPNWATQNIPKPNNNGLPQATYNIYGTGERTQNPREQNWRIERANMQAAYYNNQARENYYNALPPLPPGEEPPPEPDPGSGYYPYPQYYGGGGGGGGGYASWISNLTSWNIG